MNRRFPLPILAAIALSACGDQKVAPVAAPAEEVSAAGIASVVVSPSAAQADTLFSKLDPGVTGVAFSSEIDNTHPLRRLYTSGMACGGLAVGDVDGNGLPDLFFTNGPKANALYLQETPFAFKVVEVGLDGGENWGAGAVMVDIDNDGDLDIYVCNYDAPNELYVNRGDLVFEEMAADFGLAVADASRTPAFCDYDRDGDLDLFLLTNRYYHPNGKLPKDAAVLDVKPSGVTVRPEFEKYVRITKVGEGDRPGTKQYFWEDSGRPDYLFENDGGRFTDVTKAAGIASQGFGLSATWWDYNEDGYPDLYVGNDLESPDAFYRNNGDGTFTDIVKDAVPHTTWFSMGADFGDLDEDGRPDFLIADMSATTHYKQKTAMGAMGDKAEFLATAVPRQYMRNALFLNAGGDRFREAAYLAGLANTDWTWTVKLCDFDNDSRLDAFFTTGMSKNFNTSDSDAAREIRVGETEWDRHTRAGTPELREQNLAFRNVGGMKFENVSKAWGLDHVGMSFAGAHADLDRDGDLDLVVANLSEPVSIYRNESRGNRIAVDLRGVVSNRSGVGARVTVTAGGKTQEQEATIVRGYVAGHEPRIHFGLGEATSVSSLVVEWPSGHRQEFSDVAANAIHTVTEPSGAAIPEKRVPSNVEPPLFAEMAPFPEVRHFENVFDDFLIQPLLPNKMSQFGPGLAVADINGDGLDDFAMSGAQGAPTTLVLNAGGGRFGKGALQDAVPKEDLGLLFFDADADGDQDLYVVTGGAGYRPGTDAYGDRLYLNNGSGNFSPGSDRITGGTTSGSVAVAGDYDRDGDLDLFVGGRFVPGSYPETPQSSLLRNEGGRFVDASAETPGLADTGLVTGALFTDVDGDGWLDLMVTHEWGPVKCFRNREGKLEDATAAAGLAERLGWWNGIAGGDLDRDGDMDYVVTNFGKNTKYHADAGHPAAIYYGDFEGDGTKHIVEAEFEGVNLFPIRGRSCSLGAMPHIGNKYGTFHKFALASLQEIYTPQCLEDALKLECNELRSGVLVNDGSGKFEFNPLPKIAQIAPAFGVVVTELDGDGVPDVFLSQNSYAPQAETGRMAGGLGQLLRGKGDGSFEPVAPSESGIAIRGDMKAAAVGDFDGDARPEILVGVNSGKVHAYSPRNGGKWITVRLTGKPGNPTAVGARVTLVGKSGERQTAEVTAGAGYLSQSSSKLFFGGVTPGEIAAVEVRWPSGKSVRVTDGFGKVAIEIAE